jgi:hypothetical protein
MHATTSRVHATNGRVHETIGRVPRTIDQVPPTIGRMSEEIVAKYHICLTPYRAEPGMSNMFHKWIRHIRWSETWQFIIEVVLYITSIIIHVF